MITSLKLPEVDLPQEDKVETEAKVDESAPSEDKVETEAKVDESAPSEDKA